MSDMNDPETPQLKIAVPLATPAELERGLTAALDVFIATGVTPLEAAVAVHARAGWEVSGYTNDFQISDSELAAAEVWDDAEGAAFEAVCDGWTVDDREKPKCISLQLLTRETQLADRRAALAGLKSIAQSGNGSVVDIADFAWILAEELGDQFLARQLVDEVTISFTRMTLVEPDSVAQMRVAEGIALLSHQTTLT
jgi:hypothetical protein